MSTLVVASSREDAAAVEAVENHHAQLSGKLGVLVDRAIRAAGERVGTERDALVAFARTELLPHAAAEEQTMYPAAHVDPAARLLVDAMLAEHAVIAQLVDQLAAAATGVEAAAYGRALQVFFDSHLTKENEQILPLLAADPTVSVAGLLSGMHELLGAAAGPEHGGDDDASAGGCGCGHDHGPDHGHHGHAAAHQHAHGQPAATSGHTCGCGHEHDEAVPELDARVIPHDIRHATIFGALGAVPSGGRMVLVAPHDPLPLLAQIEGREPGVWSVGYLERGPEAWRLLFERAAGATVA